MDRRDSEFWQDAQSRVRRARDLLRRRQLPEALEELRAAAEIDPLDPVHHRELGRCLSLLGRHDESADAFARAAEAGPLCPQNWLALGGALLELGRWREAAEALDRAGRLDPIAADSYAGRVRAYAALGDHDRAEQMFYLAQQVDDRLPAPFYHVAASLAERGETARARWCWRRTIELAAGESRSPHRRAEAADLATRSYLRLAELDADAGDLEHGRRHYLQALARDGRRVESLLGLAELLLRMRQHDAAAERIHRAVRLDPDDPRGHFLAGRRYFEIGRLNEAAVALRRVVEIDPGFPRGHLMLAKLAARQDDAEGVCRHCRLEMMRRPDRPAVLAELGGLLADAGDLEHAAACYKRLVATEPGDAAAWQNLGAVECLRGELMPGVIASRRAIKLDPANLDAHNNLALAFLQMRELDAAAKVLADGLALDPRHRPLRRLRLRLRLLRTGDRLRAGLRRLLGREDD